MNRSDGFTTYRQRQRQTEFEHECQLFVYRTAEYIPGLTYIQKCRIRDKMIEACDYVYLPSWTSDRRGIASMFLGLLLLVILGAAEIWLFNSGLHYHEVRSFIAGAPAVGLDTSVVHQILIAIIAAFASFFVTRPRMIWLGLVRMFQRSPQLITSYRLASNLLTVSTLVGVPWVIYEILYVPRRWLAGWMLFLGLTFLIAKACQRAENAFMEYLWEIRRPPRERPPHLVIWTLFIAAAGFYSVLPDWDSEVRSLRRSFAIVARNLERSRVPMYATWRREVALRRELRGDQARLAALLRAHSRELAKVYSSAQYLAICDSLRSSLLSAVDLDWPALLATAPQVTRASRVLRMLRRFASSLAMIFFAVVIPLLPGVQDSVGANVRVLLLGTALLALIPIGDSASSTIKDAMGKALAPSGSKPAG